MIHGGYRDSVGIKEPLADMTRLRRSAQNVWSWETVVQFPGTSGTPSARCGHVGLLDEARDRLLVFGGAASPTAAPTDASVWAFTFDDDDRLSGTWSKPTVSGPGPLAVAGASMAFDSEAHRDSINHRFVKRAFVFGGRADSASVITGYRNTLHILTIDESTGALSWSKPTMRDALPTARSDASLVLDHTTQRLFVLGGVDSSGSRLSTVRRTSLDVDSTSGRWDALASLDVAVSGSSAVLASSPDFSRIPEVLDTGTGTFTAHTSSPLLMDWYPFVHLLPRNGTDSAKVFVSGPDSLARMYTPDASVRWTDVGGKTGRGGSSVQYRNGKVLKAGTRDTEGSTDATGRTWTIDLSATTPAWT